MTSTTETPRAPMNLRAGGARTYERCPLIGVMCCAQTDTPKRLLNDRPCWFAVAVAAILQPLRRWRLSGQHCKRVFENRVATRFSFYDHHGHPWSPRSETMTTTTTVNVDEKRRRTNRPATILARYGRWTTNQSIGHQGVREADTGWQGGRAGGRGRGTGGQTHTNKRKHTHADTPWS